MDFYAHSSPCGSSRDYPPPDGWQPLKDHLLGVAKLAEQFAREARPGDEAFAKAAYLAGLLHDLGKYSEAFQKLILGAQARVEHSGAGAVVAKELRSTDAAFAIAGHHAGLPGFVHLKQRLQDNSSQANETRPHFAREICAIEDLVQGFSPTPHQDPLSAEFMTRMIFSCLIDADRLNTEKHFDPDSFQRRTSTLLDPEQRLDGLLSAIRLRAAEVPEGVVKQVRALVLKACLAAADGPPGVFSLTVPTGGGKTLASMAFALRHAARHNLRRVIVVVPFLSIIEQNAGIYCDALGGDAVLEHHSAVVDDGENTESERQPSTVWRRLTSENWDAPIVVTTAVRFFESLFSNRPGDCRRLHRIPRSVVILDEVQTLPPGLLSPILDVLDRFAGMYGTTVLLSTATQPAFERSAVCTQPARQDQRWGAGRVREIVPDPPRLFADLRRVDVHWPSSDAPRPWAEIADRMAERGQALCVVNTRDQALRLFRLLRDRDTSATFHLSTRMCPAHRKAVLDRVRKALASEQPCLLASTQLVEAGVDVDFPLVLRAFGPLDGVAQAAGRCNREGKLSSGDVFVFHPETGGLPKGGYETSAQVTRTMLAQGGGHLDIHDPTTYRRYFDLLYGARDLDAERIQESRRAFDFPVVAERFRMIDDATVSVIVPYGEQGRALVNTIRNVGQVTSATARQLQRYTVGLYETEFRHALAGTVTQIADGVFACVEGRYDPATGIQVGDTDPAALLV